MTTNNSPNAGKGAIFDLDGTLLDSMNVWSHVDATFLRLRGFDVPKDYHEKVAALQFREIAVYTIARFHLKDTPEQLMDEWHRLALTEYSTTVLAKPHAAAYIRHLKDTGARLAVATSLPPQLRQAAMRHVGIDTYFDAACSVDDAGDVGKDHPDVYLLAARRMGVPPQRCTVFEDILIGLHSAKRAGMRIWGVHDESSQADWKEICRFCDGAISDFSDAPPVL